VLAAEDVTSDKEGITTLNGIPHGTKVTITEKSVSAPYTIDTTSSDLGSLGTVIVINSSLLSDYRRSIKQ
jgi:hypothetical protein